MNTTAPANALRVGAIAIAIFASSVSAQAQNPNETEATRLVREVRQAGRSPRAMLPLLALFRSADSVRPEIAERNLTSIVNDRAVSAPIRMQARQMLAQLAVRRGDAARAREEVQAIGYVSDWRVIGPFDNEGKTGFARVYPPEEARMAALDPSASYEGRERSVAWRTYPNVTPFGYVSFDAVFRPDTNVCAYAETFVTSERAQPLTLWVGGGGAVRVYWNGEAVHEDGAYRLPFADRAAVAVGAHAGLNRVLVKACVTDRTWGFFLRLGDPTGGALPAGITISSQASNEAVAQIHRGHGVRPSAAPLSALAALEAEATGEHPSAQALENLARLMVLTGADEPAEGRARQLAIRAAELDATVSRLTLASELANHRGDMVRFARQAFELAPNDPNALLRWGTVTSNGANPDDALPILRRLRRDSPAGMRGALLEAELMRTLGFPDAARTLIEEVAARAPGTPDWLGARAAAAGAAERRDEMIRLRTELVALRYDDLGSRRVLIDDALARGEADAVYAQLAAYESLAADQSRTYIMAAELYEALGRMDEAFAAYRRGLAIAPDEALLHIAHGHALLRMDQADAAAAALRAGLALRPQDAPTRELLEQLSPEARADEAFAVAPEALLERRSGSSGYPITVLEDLAVTTVFPSGLGSRFHQTAVQIHDEAGARQWRTYAIQFDPDVQRVLVRQARVFRNDQVLSSIRTVEQSLGEPWYRMYYDTRALVVVYPDLQPGDVVEIQYRLDDVAPRNLFHDYFGDLTYLRRQVPVRALDYVLITPSDRRFYFNHPEMPDLVHETSEANGQRTDHFHVADIPALREEPSMPGMTELVPYLHVSTYETWESVGRWYWGLIQDQLHADESIRRVVRDLMRGATDTRTKVARIYDWVIRNTRYVALEFGIHGFLPYRVADIASRGFGDCKDKASLIYVMLQEAGVDARVVLTRTRRNGAIRDLPASLSVFDHAIAYVPELDLYLDGTAEFTGIDELPAMDQGVTVLRVGPNDVELTRTPILPAQQNLRQRTVDLQLSADGSGQVRIDEEIAGVEAPGYRSRYEAVATRQARLEHQNRALFPGLTITRGTFENLDDFNAPVRIQFEATAPALAVRDGTQLRIASTTLHDLTSELAPSSTRTLPLDLGHLASYREVRTVHLPIGFGVGELPEGGTLESPFGRLAIRVEREGRDIRTHTEFAMTTDRVAPADYPAFRNWVERADRVLRQRLTVRSESAQ